MPPLTGRAERYAPRATWFCIDRVSEAGRSRSASLAPSGQRSGLAASLAPVFLAEPAGCNRTHASSSQGCLIDAAASAHSGQHGEIMLVILTQLLINNPR